MQTPLQQQALLHKPLKEWGDIPAHFVPAAVAFTLEVARPRQDPLQKLTSTTWAQGGQYEISACYPDDIEVKP